MKVQLFLFFFCLTLSAFSQGNVRYDYLKACPGINLVDTTILEIDGIGEVEVFGFGIDKYDEAALNIYRIPPGKRNKNPLKILNFAVDTHIQTWKNNSKILLNKIHSVGKVRVSDLRLHIKIENIYMHVLTILDGDTIYQILSFPDNYSESDFDALTKKILTHQCL
ncbi:MAG: hypothetical protein ABWZ25_18085 [Chitinophagaceae bacterium]